MLKRSAIRRYIRQLLSLIEKQISLELRIKANLITRVLNPIIQLLVLIFLFGLIFNTKGGYSLGYWNSKNYILFLLLGFCLQFSKSIIGAYRNMFMREKYWKTLSAIMVAPVNRFLMLLGILISELVMNSLPLILLIIIGLILFPISIYFFLLVLLVFFSIFLIFAAIGLLIGAFGISHEELVPYSLMFIRIVFWFSCINYPKEIFPEIIQNIMILNPFYYIFDLLRLVWYLGIDYEVAILLITPTHIITIVSFTILSPICSIYIFNRLYKKYGITGY